MSAGPVFERRRGEGAAMSPVIAGARLLPCRLGQEDPEWRFSQGGIPQLDGWLLEIASECGRVGYGHIECIPSVSDTYDGAKAAADSLLPILDDENPLHIARLMERVDQALHEHNHVKSAFDCALHELAAQILRVPLHALFGGALKRDLEMTRIVPIKQPDAMAANAQMLVDRGYRNLKIKLSGEAELDLSRIKSIRREIGDTIRLSVDPNQAYTTRAAILTMQQLERFGVDLVEQPVPARDLDGLREVRRNVNMWVEADEAVNSVADALDVISKRAADSINIKIGDVGGLRKAAEIANLCDAAGLGYRIGAAFGPQVLNAQAAHVAATFRSHFYPQEIAEFEHFTGDPSEGLKVENGYLWVGDPVGSGTTVLVQR